VTAKQKKCETSEDESESHRSTSSLETQLDAPRPDATILGFTATFSRHDQLALSSVFDEIVHHQDVWDMLQAGWLAPARFTTIKAKIQLAECAVSERTGDFVAKGLSGKVNTEEVNELVVRTWLDRAGE
jgi:ATP-dependent helicase IRC3